MTPTDDNDPAAILNEPGLIEALAAVEHDRWSHWQRYLHAKCTANPDGSLTIPADLVQRWETQLRTAYENLPEDQKQSDRDQVDQYLPLVARALRAPRAPRPAHPARPARPRRADN